MNHLQGDILGATSATPESYKNLVLACLDFSESGGAKVVTYVDMTEHARSFSNYFKSNVFHPNDSLVAEIIGDKPTLAVLDEAIPQEKKALIRDYLQAKSLNILVYELKGGEHIKTRVQADRLVDLVFEKKLKQIVAIGGGTIIDLCGFVAAQARRGMPIVRIPTTLLAQANVGASRKVGVNHMGLKNALGFFHSPKAVITDTTFLESPPQQHNRSGIAEMIKAAIVSNPTLFSMLEEHFQELVDGRQFADLEQIVYTSLVEHLRNQAQDHNDTKTGQGIRLGHALAHPFEEVTHGQLAHGEAVALDILIASFIAYRRRMLSADDFNRIVALHLKVSLPVYHREITQEVISQGFKNVVERRSEIVVPTGVGRVGFIGFPTEHEIRGSLNFLRALESQNPLQLSKTPGSIADLASAIRP